MTHEELLQLLADEGFNTGWVVCDGELKVWEHDEDPPSPLTRPEVQNDLAD